MSKHDGKLADRVLVNLHDHTKVLRDLTKYAILAGIHRIETGELHPYVKAALDALNEQAPDEKIERTLAANLGGHGKTAGEAVHAWHKAYHRAAWAEGWSLWTTDHGPQVQRFDDPHDSDAPPVHLNNDDEAHAIVATGMIEQREHAMAAMAVLREHNISEYRLIFDKIVAQVSASETAT